MDNLQTVIGQFALVAKVISIEPYGSGHINDTYLVVTYPETSANYILQRINHKIFPDIQNLMENICQVTSHMKNKLELTDQYFGFKIVQPLKTINGQFYHLTPDGNYWRVYDFMEGSKSFDLVGTPEKAFQGGKAFGIFHSLTSDFPVPGLYEVLPGFHDISLRLEKFRKTVLLDPAGRSANVVDEISFVEKRAPEMQKILEMGKAGLIPLRVTHNDTKFNNILFNAANEAISVIDFDTVMPGYVLYDFGDAIRTGASTAAEDEKDLSKIDINLALFKAYAEGYLGIATQTLSPVEKENLAFSAKFMTYIIGLRFLTDYVDGDRYFKIAFPGHNLQRARAQFKLLRSMEKHFTEMERIIRDFD